MGVLRRGPTRGTVRIAFVGPLTGGPAAKGQSARNAALLAVAQRNESGASPWRYELVVGDDACDPAVGAAMAEVLASDVTITAGVTHYCSEVALRCVDVYHRHALPVVVWGAHAAAVTDANDYPEIHRVSGVFANEDEAAAAFMRDLGYHTWVIIHDPTHYGHGHAEGLSRALMARGGEIRLSREIGIDQQDFTGEVEHIREAGVEVVAIATAPGVWWTTHGPTVDLVRPPTDAPGWMPAPARLGLQMRGRGVTAVLQGPASLIRDRRVVTDLDAAGEGTIAFEEGAPIEDLPGGPEFDAAYCSARFAEPYESFGPFAHATTTLVMDAINRVGPDRARVMAALNRTAAHPSLIGPITFNEKGQNVAVPITAYVAQDGAWMPWRRSAYARGSRNLPLPPRVPVVRS